VEGHTYFLVFLDCLRFQAVSSPRVVLMLKCVKRSMSVRVKKATERLPTWGTSMARMQDATRLQLRKVIIHSFSPQSIFYIKIEILKNGEVNAANTDRRNACLFE